MIRAETRSRRRLGGDRPRRLPSSKASCPSSARSRSCGARGRRAPSRPTICAPTTHRNHILDITAGPGRRLGRDRGARPSRIARADRRGARLRRRARGRDVPRARGRRGALVVNEIAPRVHNSGHWTIERRRRPRSSSSMCAPSAAGRSARPARLGRIEMTNLIGARCRALGGALAEPGPHLHLYGKRTSPARPQDGPRHAGLSGARLNLSPTSVPLVSAPAHLG